jgi:anti-anti-sigma factor
VDVVPTNDFVVLDGLDIEARQRFVAAVAEAIDGATGRTAGQIGLDCSQITSLDDGALGMLVTIARAAQRRGKRVILTGSSERVRTSLDAAGVSHFFD